MENTIEGWRAIAEALGVSERHAVRYGVRDDDPLPVRKRFGRVYIQSTELYEWVQRQDQSYGQARPATA